MRPPSRATCSRSNGRRNQDDRLNSRKRTGPDGFPRPKLAGNSILPSPLLSIPSALTWESRSGVKNLERVAPFIVQKSGNAPQHCQRLDRARRFGLAAVERLPAELIENSRHGLLRVIVVTADEHRRLSIGVVRIDHLRVPDGAEAL